MGIRRFIGISLVTAALGCATEPSDQCLAYAACQQGYDEVTGNAPVDVAQYQEGGACWDSAENAARCTDDCEAGLALLADAATDEGLELPVCD
ncbi:MAG: hypothetical protein A2138_27110 [Deltaproteobacteria bacterium RBG_16_71_12]|nr:MAG: hypothetical protein A2138_27110 [Deltaproteobacteria bacterium RBG_16_71_12]